jgi:hypothetical protein
MTRKVDIYEFVPMLQEKEIQYILSFCAVLPLLFCKAHKNGTALCKIVKKFKKIFKKLLTLYRHGGIIIYVRQREKENKVPFTKGSEEMDGMTARQTVRLIEWLRANGFTESQIVECIEYINK